MARRIIPCSFECDCGHESDFCEGRCRRWKRTAAAVTNRCSFWIPRSRNTLSSLRKGRQLQLFAQSWGAARSRGWWQLQPPAETRARPERQVVRPADRGR